MEIDFHEISRFFAGLSGSLVFAFVRPDREDWLRSMMSVLGGALTSFFLAPAFCEWRDLESVHAKHAVAFGFGLIGMIVCRLVVTSAQSESAKTAWEAVFRGLKRMIGIKDEPGG